MSASDDAERHAARLTALEEKLTFLEDTLESLNEVVLEHGRQLERATAGIDDLKGRLADLSDAQEKRSLEDDRPPHY